MIFYGFWIPLCSAANSPSINDCSCLCRFAFLRFIVISSSLVKPINYPVKCSRAVASARCRHFCGTFNDHLRSIFFTLSLAKQHRGKRHHLNFHFIFINTQYFPVFTHFILMSICRDYRIAGRVFNCSVIHQIGHAPNCCPPTRLCCTCRWFFTLHIAATFPVFILTG